VKSEKRIVKSDGRHGFTHKEFSSFDEEPPEQEKPGGRAMTPGPPRHSSLFTLHYSLFTLHSSLFTLFLFSIASFGNIGGLFYRRKHSFENNATES
jgi:hypothetical protein